MDHKVFLLFSVCYSLLTFLEFSACPESTYFTPPSSLKGVCGFIAFIYSHIRSFPLQELHVTISGCQSDVKEGALSRSCFLLCLLGSTHSPYRPCLPAKIQRRNDQIQKDKTLGLMHILTPFMLACHFPKAFGCFSCNTCPRTCGVLHLHSVPGIASSVLVHPPHNRAESSVLGIVQYLASPHNALLSGNRDGHCGSQRCAKIPRVPPS